MVDCVCICCGIEYVGIGCVVVECVCIVCVGVECVGVECVGVECEVCVGVKGVVVECCGIGYVGIGCVVVECVCIVCVGVGCVGVECVGVECIDVKCVDVKCVGVGGAMLCESPLIALLLGVRRRALSEIGRSEIDAVPYFPRPLVCPVRRCLETSLLRRLLGVC